MVLSILFFVALGLTAAGVVMTVRAGRRGDRKLHLVRALSTVVLLVGTVLLALQLGEVRDFPDPAMAIHTVVARTSGLLVLAVVVTGILLWRWPGWRVFHRGCVYAMLVAMATAIATGIWAFCLSTSKS